MKFSQIITHCFLVENHAFQTKAEIIEHLLIRLADEGQFSRTSVPALLQAVLSRESLGTTAIGDGVAMPHAKSRIVGQRLCTLALCRPEVEASSLDGLPV